MKKFSEIKVGDEFFSTCSISEKELTEYFKFSRVKNAFLEDMQNRELFQVEPSYQEWRESLLD